MAATIDSVFRAWAASIPDRAALCFPADAVSYAQLDAWVGRVAVHFVACGARPGDRICIYAENSLEWCVAALAAIRIGGIVTGLLSRMVAAELAYPIGNYLPAIIVVDGDGADRLREALMAQPRGNGQGAQPQIVPIEQIAALRTGPASDVVRDLSPEAPAVIIPTSGSAGRSKGVVQMHRSIIEYNCAFFLNDPIDDGARMLIVPPFGTAGGCLQMLQILMQGGTGYVIPKFAAEEALQIIQRERISIFLGAPIFFSRIADCPDFADADLSCLKITYTGGAAVATKLLKLWAGKGVILRQLYGQTECGGIGTVNSRELAITHPEMCGRGGPLRDIAIIDDAGARCASGQAGQIILRCAGMMSGYWNDPETTAQALVDGWLRTGDIGCIDDQGLLKFIERAKDIIISGGLNISASEVERVILECHGIEEVAVIAAPDEKFGETPLAIIRYEPGSGLSIPELLEHCANQLSSYKVPKHIQVHPEALPRLANGKIAKQELRRQYPGTTSLE